MEDILQTVLISFMMDSSRQPFLLAYKKQLSPSIVTSKQFRNNKLRIMFYYRSKKREDECVYYLHFFFFFSENRMFSD